MKKLILLSFIASLSIASKAQKPVPVKPRILISTDIGGTDPDDNQSMIHLLMYSHMFDIEGLVSSPSYGEGSKQEILRTIDLYEKASERLSISKISSVGKQTGEERGSSFHWVCKCHRGFQLDYQMC